MWLNRHGMRFGPAGPEHDAGIARLLAQGEMPGRIALCFRCAPGWHRPLARSIAARTIVGLDGEGRVRGMATRATHPVHLDGRATQVDWLGQLRVDEAFRHRVHLLRAGLEAMARAGDARDAPIRAFASIVKGNAPARRLLERGLPGFPRFAPAFDYETIVLSTRDASGGAERVLADAELDEAMAFFESQSRERDLSIRVDAAEIRAGGWAGLAAGDMIALRADGGIVACAAIWRQTPFREIGVTAYSQPLRALRLPLNAFARLSGAPVLPPPGAALKQAYLSLAAARGDDPALWRGLVQAARAHARRRGADLLTLGFAAGDPAGTIIRRRFRHLVYASRIYEVGPEESRDALSCGLNRPRIDVGLL